MTGGEYRFQGVQAIEVLSTQFNAIADMVNDAIRSLIDEHRVDVQAHYIPINEGGDTTSVIVMLHYGKNVSPF